MAKPVFKPKLLRLQNLQMGNRCVKKRSASFVIREMQLKQNETTTLFLEWLQSTTLVANTRPVGGIQPSALFYPAQHLVLTQWQR